MLLVINHNLVIILSIELVGLYISFFSKTTQVPGVIWSFYYWKKITLLTKFLAVSTHETKPVSWASHLSLQVTSFKKWNLSIITYYVLLVIGRFLGQGMRSSGLRIPPRSWPWYCLFVGRERKFQCRRFTGLFNINCNT